MIKDLGQAFRKTVGGVLMRVQALPRSSCRGILGLQNGFVKIKLSSPPLDGRANEECVEVIAKALRISKGDVEIVAGKKGRVKTILLHGVSEQTLTGFFENNRKLALNGKLAGGK